MTRMSRPAFIQHLAPIVQRVRAEGSPMFPSVRLAQNILETGCIIHPWYNLGGIKVGSGKPNAYWRGKVINKAHGKFTAARRSISRRHFGFTTPCMTFTRIRICSLHTPDTRE